MGNRVPKSAQTIKSEIEERFGFFPPFFEPALETPRVLENLWQQTLSAYIENPWPALFKEKLAALLARYCSVPYCLICHSCSLVPLGLKAPEVLELLEQDLPKLGALEENIRYLDRQKLDGWPEAGSLLEEGILSSCVAIFTNQNSELAHRKLRSILTTENYDFLIAFIAYNQTCLTWAEAHPELSIEADVRVQMNLGELLEQEPALAKFFRNYSSVVEEQKLRRTASLQREHQELVEKERRSNARFHALQERLGRIENLLGIDSWHFELDGKSELSSQMPKLFERLQPEDHRLVTDAFNKAVKSGEMGDVRCNASGVRAVGWTVYDPDGKPKSFQCLAIKASKDSHP